MGWVPTFLLFCLFMVQPYYLLHIANVTIHSVSSTLSVTLPYLRA